MKKNGYKCKFKINKIGESNVKITDRSGMGLFEKYLNSVEIFPLLQSFFGGFGINNKGLPVWNILKQIFYWLYDGASRYLNYFDQLKEDDGRS